MHIFRKHSTNCLTLEQITHYLNYTLPIDELPLVTEHLNDCSLCSEAIEGALLFANGQSLELDKVTQQLQDIAFILLEPIKEV